MFSTDPYALIVVLVSMSLLPFVAMIATSYLKIVVVISLIRNALGIQSIPPNMVVNALALVLTLFIMAPCVRESWQTLDKGMGPEKTPAVLYRTDLGARAAEPYRQFLMRQTEEKQVAFFVRTAEKLWSRTDESGNVVPGEVDRESFFILIPAFCVSELTRAFEIGFLVYLPFVAIDIIVSNILLALGMMMVSPVTISLPFKLLLFVMVNGWTLLVQGLVQCYIR